MLSFSAGGEAVASALTLDELAQDRVVPHPARIRAVSLDVATATVLECQRLGIARRRALEGAATAATASASAGDERIARLVGKWLKAGVLEDGQWSASDQGTPQGAVISPLLANVYLHYVFDLWAQQWRRR
jgi:hypothetical protein